MPPGVAQGPPGALCSLTDKVRPTVRDTKHAISLPFTCIYPRYGLRFAAVWLFRQTLLSRVANAANRPLVASSIIGTRSACWRSSTRAGRKWSSFPLKMLR